jgi:hypothetical protein
MKTKFTYLFFISCMIIFTCNKNVIFQWSMTWAILCMFKNYDVLILSVVFVYIGVTVVILLGV